MKIYQIIPWYLLISITVEGCLLDEDINLSSRSNFLNKALEYRLPGNLYPISYDILLEPDLTNFIFKGSVEIRAKITNSSDTIILHSNELTNIVIKNITEISPDDSNPKEVVNQSLDQEKQFLVILLDGFLTSGNEVVMAFDYIGSLNGNKIGFYRGSYFDQNGEEKWFASTQFEHVGARMAFPCFDEPGMKSTFKVSIVREENQVALANGALIESLSLPNGKIQDSFKQTPVMGITLVAFHVAEFSAIFSADGKYSVYGRPEPMAQGQGQYLFDITKPLVEAMENLTDFPYPLDKLYNVGIPDEWYLAGGMENWGLITHAERGMFYLDTINTAKEKQKVLQIQAHEVSHLWFSALVSYKWWNHVWLKEGFATYFEGYLLDVLEPNWRMNEQFPGIMYQNAFRLDSTESSKAVNYDVQTPDEIFIKLFDLLTYQKSGAVVTMMEHILTPKIFKRGLQLYLEDMKYQAAEEDDLYRSLQLAADEVPGIVPDGVGEIMSTWFSQAGYPVVNVSRNGDGTIKVSQERFYLEPPLNPKEELWYIPISFASSNNSNFDNTQPTHWLKDQEMVLDLVVPEGSWIILNNKQSGYYRVNYDQNLWREIILKIKDGEEMNKIHPVNRAQLLDDALNLCRAGHLSYLYGLDLVQYLRKEDDYIPWYSFYENLDFLNTAMSSLPEYEDFRASLAQIIFERYRVLTVEEKPEDTHLDKLERNFVVKWLCYFGHADCLMQANNLLRTWEAIPPNVQEGVYCGGMVIGGKEEFDHLVGLYGSGIGVLHRQRVLSGLGCTRNTSVSVRILEDVLSNSTSQRFILPEDVVPAFASVYGGSTEGVDLTLDFVIGNFEEVRLRLSTGQINGVLQGLSERLTKFEQMTKMEAFVSNQESDVLDEFGPAFDRVLKNMEKNRVWTERNREDIARFYGPDLPSEDKRPL